jgi:hypothetical protein
MSEPPRTAPDARLPDAVDGVLAAARRWRTRRAHWTTGDTSLEHRIWLELRDLQDRREHAEDARDLVGAVVRLVDHAPARESFPREAAELGWAIETLGALRDDRPR